MTPERWQQVKDIFQSLVDSDANERARLLERACGEDLELRHEIERLLESDEQAPTFLESSPITPQQELLTRTFDGRKIGPYRVVSLLGTGGMGEVYQAQDTRLDRTVALKILPANVANDERRMKRFAVEAKAASALNHPNVATIYDIGESDGISFIAMEYVEGQTLDQKIKCGPMDAIDIQTIARQVAEALDHAHHKGIIHRDIKPANLIVTSQGQVKVLDFGLAKMSREAPFEQVRPATTTLPGLLMGTVEYMSPEQALAQEVDRRTDVFSLGVVLYEMATGRSPFAGDSITQTIDRIVHAEPEPISRLNSKIPLKLQRVIEKCLEKKRERRYQSARELSADLTERRLAASFARTVTSPSFGSRSTKVFRAFAVLILITLAVIISQRVEKTGRRESNHIVVEASSSSTNSSTTFHNPISPPITKTVDRDAVSRPSVISADATTKGGDNDIPTIEDPIFSPFGVAVAPNGTIYVADGVGMRIYKVLGSGRVLRFAGTGTPGFSGDGGPAISAQLNNPSRLALDLSGNLYFVDEGNLRIRKITPAGLISTVAGNGISGTTGDGGPGTLARLSRPTSVAVDEGGAVYLADMDRIRKITQDGVINTIFKADPLPGPRPNDVSGIAVDRAGDVYVATYHNSRVLKVTPNGAVRTVAGNGTRGVSGDGGPATSAQLSDPVHLAVDTAGNLFIAGIQDIRKVTADGMINTLVRSSTAESGVPDRHAGGEVTNALANPLALALDGRGNLYVAQNGTRSVLKMTPEGKIATAIASRGNSKPDRMGQHGVAVTTISRRASLWSDGRTSYFQGTPQIVIENPSRIDATVSFNSLLSQLPERCKFAFEISSPDSSETPQLLQQGAGPTISVTGEIQPGTYNLFLRVRRDPDSPCFPEGWLPLLVHYLVTVTPH
jgi:serine/threonine protein kinase